MSPPLVILGSSRSDGYTKKGVTNTLARLSYELIDLRQLNISPYDYDHKNQNDDHLQIIEKMTLAQAVVFATPVYWYAMSAQMKTFFDRFSDLLSIRKSLQPKLKGKRCFLVAVGSDEDLPDGFETPFQKTCEYLGMTYCRSLYLRKESTVSDALVKKFIEELNLCFPNTQF